MPMPMPCATDFAYSSHELQSIITGDTAAQSYPCRPSKCPPAFAKPSKQRKDLRVRTTAISHSRISVVAKSMTDVARRSEAEKSCVAESEKLPSPCELSVDVGLQSPTSQKDEPDTPSFTRAPESSLSCRDAASPLSFLSSLDDLDMPPTPRLRFCELPMSPSIAISPFRPLSPFQSRSPPPSEEPAPEEPEFDPFDDDPLLRPLAEDWSSLDRNTSLSLAAEPSDEETWPYNNALGLYVDPAMNVTAWDAGGFIRSTAPSPSPTWVIRNRRRT